MTGSTVCPLNAVGALFLERQHLACPRQRAFSPGRVIRLAADTGGLQIDSINVVERAHYLTVWSRFGVYDRRALDRLVYRRRALFEYWAHAACLVATGHFPCWKRAMLDYQTEDRGWADWLKKNRGVIGRVRRAIRDRGPLGNSDFAHRPRSGERGGWWNWKPAAHALDYLWMSGRTLVHSRANFQKRFDLAERLMPEAFARAPLTRADFQRWHVRHSLRAMGAATESDLRMYLSFPRVDATERRRWLGALLETGEVREIQVVAPGPRGSTRWYALAEDLPALAAAERRSPSRGSTLLSPFDSFLWHRERTLRLFGFHYRIEVYTPGLQRTHGYYSLPIFHDGQLIGRLDPKTHRDEHRLEIRHVHFEPWFARGERPPAAEWGALDRDAAIAGVADSLRSLAAFVGADAISLGRVTPPALGTPLRRQLG